MKLVEQKDGTLQSEKCYMCKTGEPHIKNVRRKRLNGKEVVYMLCRDCNNLKMKKYYSKNKEKVRKIIYKSMKKHKDRQNCRQLSHYWMRKGVIQKPDNCECCGQETKVYMHHHDYTKAKEVEWLCSGCHADKHPEHRK